MSDRPKPARRYVAVLAVLALLATSSSCAASPPSRSEAAPPAASALAQGRAATTMPAPTVAPVVEQTLTLNERFVLPPAPSTSAAPSAPPGSLGASEPRPDFVRAVIRAHLPVLRACFTAPVRAREYPTGRVLLHFDIGRDGRVASAEVVPSIDGLPDDARRCALDTVRSWVFTAPQTQVVTVSFPLVLQRM